MEVTMKRLAHYEEPPSLQDYIAVGQVMSLSELTNECILDLARVWRLAWHGLSLYTRGIIW